MDLIAALTETYSYHQDGYLTYKTDSGRYGRYKAGSRAGSTGADGIRMIAVGKKYVPEHRAIWAMLRGSWPSRVIRHANGNLSDNRIENLVMDSQDRRSSGAFPSADRLREMIDYDPVSGSMTWKQSPRNRTLPGDPVGSINSEGYLIVNLDRHKIRAHRVAWAIFHGEWPAVEIDHHNRIRTDNRIANLRPATRGLNNQNSGIRSDSKTGVKGVCFRKDVGKFCAYIQVDRKMKYLGLYEDLDDAIQARKLAEKELHPFRVS